MQNEQEAGVTPSVLTRRERTFEMAASFVSEVRRDLERAARAGSDLPPRLRSVHERVGHATPEFRTLAIPVPSGASGASPEVLSGLIAQYARLKPPQCLLLALDALTHDDSGAEQSILIAEARDCDGTRFFLIQPFRRGPGGIEWDEPVGGGWRDPGEEEMILDGAFPG